MLLCYLILNLATLSPYQLICKLMQVYKTPFVFISFGILEWLIHHGFGFGPFIVSKCAFCLYLHQNSEIALYGRCSHFCISFLICLYYVYLQSGLIYYLSDLNCLTADYFLFSFFSVVSSTVTKFFLIVNFNIHSFMYLFIHLFFSFLLSSLFSSLPLFLHSFVPFFLFSSHILL